MWTLVRIARQLNEVKLPFELTDDGVVFAFGEWGDDFIYGMRIAAPEDRYALLEARGNIWEPDEDEE